MHNDSLCRTAGYVIRASGAGGGGRGRLSLSRLGVKPVIRKPSKLMNPQPLVATDDVVATSAWYQAVLGLESDHGGGDYEQLMFDGRMVMQLHRWDTDDHPHIGDPMHQSRGNGVLLWFQTDRFDEIIRKKGPGAVIFSLLCQYRGHDRAEARGAAARQAANTTRLRRARSRARRIGVMKSNMQNNASLAPLIAAAPQ